MADRYWAVGTGNWDSTANWSASPTLTPTGASVPTSADNVFFTSTAAYTVTLTSGAASSCANFTVSAGTVTITISTASLSIYGNYSVVAATVWTNATGSVNFSGSGTQTITTNGTNIQSNVQFNGTATYQLQDNFLANSSTGNTGATLTTGALDLNNKQLSCQVWASNNSNVRSIAFGTAGKIVLVGVRSGAAPVVFQMTTTTNFSLTGTAVVDFTNTNGFSTTHLFGFGTTSETNCPSINIKSGVLGTVSLFAGSLGNNYKDIDFTGFTGTLTTHTLAGSVIYGNWTFSTGMSVTTGGNTVITFSGSSNQIITSNGKAFCCPFTVNKTGGTLTLADALLLDSAATARTLTLVNGTFDANAKTINSAGAITFSSTGTVTIQNLSSGTPFTLTSGTLTQGTANTFGNFTLTAGTLNLATYQLNCPTFTSNGSSVRSIAFGTGNITLTGSGGTLFSSTTLTNFSVTGTPVVNVPYSGSVATTIATAAATEAQSISFNIQAGTYALTMVDTGKNYRSINFTGFSGTLGAVGVDTKIFGSLTLSPTMTLTSGANTMVFAGTTTGNTITTNGKQITFKLAFNGVGGSWVLQDALTMVGSSSNIRHYNGTIDLNGKTLTLAAAVNSYYTDPGTKNLTFNGGTIIGVNDFVNQTPTGFTTTAGTGIGKISVQSPAGFTFTGGGGTYNCTISNDGAGQLVLNGNNTIQKLTTTVGMLNVTGSNTIVTLANAVQPVTLQFSAGTTQTITNWQVSGTAGNLVTITSGSTSSHTLSMSSGTVSADYLYVNRSIATGGAAWYAGANSTNVTGNSGWIFTAAPSGSTITFAITEPQDTSAIGITAQTSAALAATDPPDTASIVVSYVAITAALNATEAQDAAAVAVSSVTGLAVNATEAQDAAAVAVSSVTPLALNATEANDLASVAASLFAGLSLAATEPPDNAVCVASVYTAVVLASTEARDAAAVSVSATTVSSFNVTETGDTASASALVFFGVSIAVVEPTDTASASVASRTVASFSATEAQDVAAVISTAITSATLTVTEAPDIAFISQSAALTLDLASVEPQDNAAASAGIYATSSLFTSEAKDTAYLDVSSLTAASFAVNEASDAAYVGASRYWELSTGALIVPVLSAQISANRFLTSSAVVTPTLTADLKTPYRFAASASMAVNVTIRADLTAWSIILPNDTLWLATDIEQSNWIPKEEPQSENWLAA
jgi:hypothetical protein